MEYRLPVMEDENLLREYVAEHHQNGEESISASLNLSSMPYREWLEMICKNASEGNSEWGRSLLYVCMENDEIIGLLSIRYSLSKEMTEIYGDIGYGVRPSKRNQGYATAMLSYALDICKEKEMTSVILGCYKDNLPSAAVIKKCDGRLRWENDNYQKGKLSQYYEIEL